MQSCGFSLVIPRVYVAQWISNLSLVGLFGASHAVSSPVAGSTLRGFKPIKVFDPREFLANSGIGRTIQKYGPKQAIFSQ
jgi:hypothetical protein